MTALRIIVALLAGVTASSGQGFKVTTELVTIPVTVTDRSGATMVRGLQAADFRVIEAGVEQPISAVTAARQPVSVCVVMDRSTSVVAARKEAAEALVNELLAALPLDDEVSLVTFAIEPSLELDWVRAGARPRVVWKQVPSGGGSAITDAMALAVRQWSARRNLVASCLRSRTAGNRAARPRSESWRRPDVRARRSCTRSA